MDAANADDGELHGVDNQYTGYTLTESDEPIDVVELAQTTAAQFYRNYVAKRKPCLLRGRISGTNFSRWSDLEYLKRKAGHTTVEVEQREDGKARFGRGMVRKMSFGELLTHLGKGDDRFYMTTQNLDTDEEGRPLLTAPPVTQLGGDFPLRPGILDTLVPSNYNLWMGCTKQSSSSGLHHDFHDNVYVLITGKKRFRLLSPADADKLCTVGKMVLVHPNGRICYEGQITRADGSDEEGTQADARLARAEQALAAGHESGEDEMDAALAAMLDAEMDGEAGDDFDEDDDDEEEEEEELVGQGLDAPGSEPAHVPAENSGADEKNDGSDNELPKEKPPPNNFSQINTSLSKEELEQRHPGFGKLKQTFVEVNAGDMLYLPAGWFHEVFSQGQTDEASKPPIHTAFNYWFHPPVNTTAEGYHRPYDSGFWSRDWEARSHELKRISASAPHQQGQDPIDAELSLPAKRPKTQ